MPKRMRIGSDSQSSMSSILFKYDHSNARDIMARYCAMEHQLFQFAHKSTYEYIIKKAYCPPDKTFGRKTCLGELEEKLMIKNVI